MNSIAKRLRTLTLGCMGVLGAVWVAAPVEAQTKYPGVDSVFPLVVRRGEATEVEVRTNGDVKTAYRALVEGDEVRAEVVERSEERKMPDGNAVVRLEPAADARLGPRDLRLATREAITTPARIYVTDLPATVEAADHGTLQTSQAIDVPGVVNGRVQAEVETDWYRFEAKQGERVNFEILGTRLHETIHKIGRFTPHFDAYLSVRDATGRELAASDDHYFADPFLSFEAPADGAYHVVVREANYKGHISYTYALVATRGAIATLTFPLAAPPGESRQVELVGAGMHADDRATVELPADVARARPVLVRPRRDDGTLERELPVLPSELPLAIEDEGVGHGENDTPETAPSIELPAGVAGRIAAAGDVDCFAFEAAKGVLYRFEVFSRRLFSAVDSELEVVDAKGRTVASNDDTRDLVRRLSRDSQIDWKAPADGRYVLRLRDLHGRGGHAFVYHIECARAEPDFLLTLDPELAMVGPGNRTPVYVRAHRLHGFDGEIELHVEGLPAGVEAFAPPIRAGMTDACVVLSVAADAAPDATNFTVRGRATLPAADDGGATRVLERRAMPLVEIYQAQRVIGRTAAIAVTERSDIEVTTEVEEVVLKPGDTKQIPIRLVRDAGYKSGSVSLWASWKFGNRVFGSSLPPGVSVDDRKSNLGIVGEDVEGSVALKADPKAKPVTGVPTVVIGLIPIEFSVFVPFCTKPIRVSVTAEDGTLTSAAK